MADMAELVFIFDEFEFDEDGNDLEEDEEDE